MKSSRDDFLTRVGQAVQSGNHAGSGAHVPARGSIGYEGAGEDRTATFKVGLQAAGGQLHCVRNPSDAVTAVVGLVRRFTARKALLGQGHVINGLDLLQQLPPLGIEVILPNASRDAMFGADLSITGVDFLIAEAGSLVIRSRPEEPRALTLLPPVHVAVADESQIIPDLFDLFTDASVQNLPSCLTLITGPSKTGDIELKLVTGVHGPGELHVVLITSSLV